MPLASFKDLCLDAVDPVRLGAFWAATLHLRAEAPDERGIVRLVGATPEHTVWVNPVPEPRQVKQRLHLDVNVSAVEELTALGATVLDDRFGWTVLADPEGGELCAFVRSGEITRRLFELVLDCADSASACHDAATWWAQVLGGRVVDDDQGSSWIEDVPGTPFATLDLVPVPEPRSAKNRVHLDVTTHDVGALLAAGATLLRASDDEIGWSVLADPDGNEFCAFERSAS